MPGSDDWDSLEGSREAFIKLFGAGVVTSAEVGDTSKQIAEHAKKIELAFEEMHARQKRSTYTEIIGLVMGMIAPIEGVTEAGNAYRMGHNDALDELKTQLLKMREAM